jgi:hypothetical protein
MIDKLLRKNSPIVRRPLFIQSSRYDLDLLSKLNSLEQRYKNLNQSRRFEKLLDRYIQILEPKSFIDKFCYFFDEERKKKLHTLDYFIDN